MIRYTTCRAALAAALSVSAHAATTITYEDVTLGGQGYINNTPYSAAGVTHSNSFTDWGGGVTSWSGFAVSNKTDTVTAGYGNQYSSYGGSGAGGSANFAVGYVDAFFDPQGTRITFVTATSMTGLGADFTNITYPALDMLNGTPGVSKKFGGASGNDPDYLLLTITGYFNNLSTASTAIYLADYRFADNSQDYILNTWTHVDFSALGTVDEIRFTMSSSDNGMFGMNTPSYFAMDNLAVPETSALGLAALGGLGLLRRSRGHRTNHAIARSLSK